MFKKSLIVFSIIFLLIVNLIIGYTLYNLLWEKPSSKISEVSEESMKVINIIAQATDDISSGAPVRSKRGVISSTDYDFVWDYFKKYEQLLSEDSIPEEHGYTESEEVLVKYVANLFVKYGLMNEQFIYGDMPFAASIMNSLYEELDKAEGYLYLASINELSDVEVTGTEDPESNENGIQETNTEDQTDNEEKENKNDATESVSVVPSMVELEGYVDYVYEIIGDLDKRMTISANILYDYSDGKITRENALKQIEEHVVATFERHKNYVPYDTSQFSPSDQVITNEMDSIVKELLDLYGELQIYMQNTLDDDVLVDQEELVPSTMPVTDYIFELNQLRDKLLNIQ